ncbi:DUF6134 family protein [Ponticaulis sp.]|uniref:DUF6134 family protein n=1 Tax=Ponticaulis sp. TaxID=2020902 RepID=UPI002625B6CB|nr:DUF6134 family protein [Ponticaulis sp.]MDF1681459.1 DUF6134 family protein [Ponticaulis sp.]
MKALTPKAMLMSISLVSLAAMPHYASANVAEPATDTFRWMPQDGEELRFSVLRDGDEFGEHIVRFEVEDDEVRVENDIELEVKFGPIRVFHYLHDSEEVWQNGQLVFLEGETKKEGDDYTVVAERAGDALNVNGTLFSGDIAPTITPSSHWNISQVMGERILSTESGEILDIEVSQLGEETIEAGGESITAQRYRLVSDLTVDLWYDEAGRWVKCEFDARGQTIEYVLR